MQRDRSEDEFTYLPASVLMVISRWTWVSWFPRGFFLHLFFPLVKMVWRWVWNVEMKALKSVVWTSSLVC